jgi:hypothetical protein
VLFDFSEAERNAARRALEIYVTELREEIVKTGKHEWREALHACDSLWSNAGHQLADRPASFEQPVRLLHRVGG